jgi:hypothetical protein
MFNECIPLLLGKLGKQGYFCDGKVRNAVPKVLSQKTASWNGIPEPLFPGTGITNTTLLRPNFGSFFAFWDPFENINGPDYK